MCCVCWHVQVSHLKCANQIGLVELPAQRVQLTQGIQLLLLSTLLLLQRLLQSAAAALLPGLGGARAAAAACAAASGVPCCWARVLWCPQAVCC